MQRDRRDKLKSDSDKIIVAAIVAPDDGIRYEAPNPIQPSCSLEGQGAGFNGYRYAEFVAAFGRNGFVESICLPEYDLALEALFEHIMMVASE